MRPESVAPQSASRSQPQRRAPLASITQAVPSMLIAHTAAPAPGTHATQRLAAVSQTGVAPEHCASEVHPTQRPASRPAVAHTGVAPLQSEGVAGEHGRHIRAPVSQMGVPPAQSALVAQPTQRLVPRSHTPLVQLRLVVH